MITTVIGIDCAVDPKNVGLAKALFDGSNLQVLEVESGETESNLRKTLANWSTSDGRVLLALDAPLGWPADFGRVLINHKAGMQIDEAADKLFRRRTDEFITEVCNKRPLDVGADRIARTAHAALRLLADVAESIHESIPLAWSASYTDRVAAIEVYPGATLTSRRIRSSQYKKPEQADTRQKIIDQLSEHISFSTGVQHLVKDADVLDAVVCALAGLDFLRGDAPGPDNPEIAQREGWIWSRIPGTPAVV